jgi:hypothetical protein
MPSNLARTDIPRDRTDVIHLLFLVDDNLDRLNPAQRAAIREIYRLDDNRSIEQRVRAGEIL